MLSLLSVSAYLIRAAQSGEILSLDNLKDGLYKVCSIFRQIIMSVDAKFTAAVKVIKSLPADGPYQPSNDIKLKFYSLYKQATEGPCKVNKPAFWDVIGRVKWEHWRKHGEMSKEEAMNIYIEELKKIVETMSFSGDVQNFLDSIGPFYEFISLNSPELDNVKELVDKATSSASCSSSSSECVSNSNSLPSSPETTPQSTPAKESEDNIPVIEVESSSDAPIKALENNYAHKNGYIPNHVTLQNHLNATGYDESVGSKPPPTPQHKPLANGHAKRLSMQEILDNENSKDEVMEVSTNEVNGNNNNKGTQSSGGSGASSEDSDSEQYYSGDSDPEPEDETVLLKSILSSSPVGHPKIIDKAGPISDKASPTSGAVRKAGKVKSMPIIPKGILLDSQGNKIDSLTVLQGTVDRLNRDVDHVLARLRILEAAYSANPSGVQSLTGQENGSTRGRRAHYKLSKGTWIFIFTWPIAVHLLFKLFSWWLERRRRLRSRPLAIL